MLESKYWVVYANSPYPWEQDALQFIREKIPDHDPYRAWSNFEFIAADGSVNEIDLLLLTPSGLFLVEIKSRPGRLSGDAGTWTWETDGKRITTDNPLIAANTKAKKLKSLLEQQQAVKKGKNPLPYVEPLVFCSAPDLRSELSGTAAHRVCLRDLSATPDKPERPGIIAAVKFRNCPGLPPSARGEGNKPIAKMLSQAMEQAGIRSSQRRRRVGDYELKELLETASTYQDWRAEHVQLPDVQRRVRIYLVRTEAAEEDRRRIERAALREFELLESLQHAGVPRSYGCTSHELGPALIFEHLPRGQRLDHFLTAKSDALSPQTRLDLLRQIAEVVRYAHTRKVVHRALCPQNILVVDPAAERPRVKILNWQVGYRSAATAEDGPRPISATSHIDRFVDDAKTAYMAPEVLSETGDAGEHLDVFSLGAIGFHLLSGVPPAANALELSENLRGAGGLSISSVLNGAGEDLQFLIQFSTHPDVASRSDSVAQFLELLDDVEKELAASGEEDTVDDPTTAGPGDVLPGGMKVVRRLGEGSSAVALLVERAGEELVLKAAIDTDHNERLADEAEVLEKLRHHRIVELVEKLNVGGRTCLLVQRAGTETLGDRLRKERRLHVDLLQRFGEDLLDAVRFLEEMGISHRDIKPDNCGVGPVGRDKQLHLILFDFSLSRTPPDNIGAGTRPYLDPLLPLRKPPRWDLHAERYAAAVTLFESATGTLPRWGDGRSDPSHVECEVQLDAEAFDAPLREPLTQFFRRAFRRDPAQRFDNAEEMLWAWRRCFERLEHPGELTDHVDDEEFRDKLSAAVADTPVAELGLGLRAATALDRANILTVEDLLRISIWRLRRLPGVSNRTRRRIAEAAGLLRQRLGAKESPPDEPAALSAEPEDEPADVKSLSVDQLFGRISRSSPREGSAERLIQSALLGLGVSPVTPWPSRLEVAEAVGISRQETTQIVDKFVRRWGREKAVTRLRADLAEIVSAAGGAMTLEELTRALLLARGSHQDEPRRSRWSAAVLRAAFEVEAETASPRLILRRDHSRLLLASPGPAGQPAAEDLADFALALGDLADKLAAEDPLLNAARAVERLREVEPPPGAEPLPDSRLLRLAAAASQGAALSSKQELYPRGLAPARAIALSQSALYGVREITVEQLKSRLYGRYPEAAPLPERPQLDRLLEGLELRWDQAAASGRGAFVRPSATSSLVSSLSSHTRHSTAAGELPAGEITPELADARQFEERLSRAARDGAFLALLTSDRDYYRAADELCRRFPVRRVDLEALMISALRDAAAAAQVDFRLVVETDARPGEGDWDKLMLLVGRAMPAVWEELAGGDRTLLLLHPGLLARYGQMSLLERLRDSLGSGGPKGAWLLIPGDRQAFIDGKAVPILSPAQRARIPEKWLRNAHRGVIGH